MKLPNLATAILSILLLPWSYSATAGDWVYYARQGDTLWDLCLQYTNKRGCWIELAQYNNVDNDRAIPVGNEIRIPRSWLTSSPGVGKVLSVAGEVNYLQHSAATAVALQAGQVLHLGARLVSGQGSASLLLGADNKLLLRANSTLDLDTMGGPSLGRSNAELSLPRGAVDVRVKPDGKSRFRITTPAAIAAVRGTEYRVNSLGADGATMRSEVLAGAVDVSAGKNATRVPAGFGVSASQGQPPGEPRKLLAAPVLASDYAVLSMPATIRWNANPKASGWQLDLLRDGPSAALLNSYSVKQPELALNDLPAGCYRLQLRAIDQQDFNGLNVTAPLCVVTKPAPVTALSAITVSPAGSAQLSWTAVDGADKYRVEIASDEGFSQVINTLTTPATSVEFTQPMDSRFSARVVTIDAAGVESDSSASQNYHPPKKISGENYVLAVLILLIML